MMMDYMSASMMALVGAAFVFAYLSLRQENKFYRMYFFVLTMIMMMSSMVIMQNPTTVTAQNWNQYNETGDLIYSFTQNTTETANANMMAVMDTDFQIVMYTMMFFVIVVIGMWILESIQKFFGGAMKTGKGNRFDHDNRFGGPTE